MRPSRSRKARFTESLCALMAFTLAILCARANVSAQQFPNPPMIVTPVDPRGLVTADFNSDGHQDLAYVTTGQVPVLHVLLGNGKGGFSEGASVQLLNGACTFEVVMCRMVVGDFTHSGHPGILMAWNVYSDWGFDLVPGNGDGTFGTPIRSQIPRSGNPGLDTLVPIHLAIADFNKDGNLDIAAADYQDAQIGIYLGDGKGNFATAGAVRDSNSPYAAYSADVNHDGNMDLVALTRYGGGAEIWLGDGAGNFRYSKTYPQNNGTIFFSPLSVADINGDGNADVIGMDGSGNIEVLIGNTNGSFNAPQSVASGFEGTGLFYAADLTGSGIPALMVQSGEGFDTAVATAKMTYGTVQKRTSGPFGTDAVFADFNEDGAPDMAVGTESGIQLFFGSHSGQFPDSTITPLTTADTFLFTGDFNGDGMADVAAIGGDGFLRTYLGSNSGALGAPVQSATAVTSNFDYVGNTVGDFDGDGHQDIAMLGQVFYGDGAGMFTPLSVTTVTAGSGGVFAADLNKDGKSDLLSISGPTPAPGANAYFYSLLALMGTAQRTFTTVTTNFTPYTPGQGITTPALLAVGDLNADGYPDAAVYDPNLPALEIWQGNGDGTFHSALIQSLTGSPWSPQGAGGQLSSLSKGVIADLDGDGNADLAFLAIETTSLTALMPTYALVVEYGNGKSVFASPQIIPLSHPYNLMSSTKLTSGGLPSIVLSDGGVIAVLRNLGGRQFSNEDYYTAGRMTGLLVADINGDGLGDLLPLRANGLVSPAGGERGLTILLNQAEALNNGNGVVNGSLSATPATVNYNQGFGLTALVVASTAGAPAPTGTVSFYALGLPLGSAPLQQGSATLQVSGAITQSMSPGIVAITANYSGDSYYTTADLTTTVQVLNPYYTTQTTLSITAGGVPISSIQAAGFFTINATVTAPSTVSHGYVAFFDGSNLIGQASISSGQTAYSTNRLAIGSHSLSAQYLGYTPPPGTYAYGNLQVLDSFQPSTSPSVPLTVTAVSTSASIQPSSTSIIAGTVLTLTANLSSPAGTPIGGVTFFDGGNALGTFTLGSNGTTAFSTASLSVGQHSLTAQYAANGIFAGSVTPPIGITVTSASAALAPTNTQIVSVTPSASSGNTITVQVTGASNSSGDISLLLDGQLAATTTLSSTGLVIMQVPFGGSGTHALVASFSGSTFNAPSASPPLLSTAYSSGQDFILQAAQAQFNLAAGSTSFAIPLNVTAVNGWRGTIAFRCVSGLPQDYVCNFSPASVSESGGTVLTLRAPARIPLSGLLLAPLAWFLRRKARRIGVWIIVLFAAIVLISSCNAPHASSSTSVITVEGDSGTLVHSVQVQVSIPSRY